MKKKTTILFASCLLVVLTCSAITFTQRNDFYGTISSSSFHRKKEIAEAPSSIPNLPLVEELKLEEEDNHQEEEQNFEFDEKEVITSQKRVKKGMRDNPSLCDMKHWVHGEFQRDKFIPSGYTRTASLKPPRDLKFTKQLYHWFSKEEAQLCLKNKKVWVIGDSYMRNLFIGLMDVLRGNLAKPNESITKGVPEKFVKIDFVPKAFGDVGRATLKSNNITATFIGGRRFGIGLYMEAIKDLFSNINNDDLIVFNVLIHDNKRNRVQSREFKGNMKKAEQFYLAKISEFVNWLQAQKPNAKVVWSTSTSYKEHKVPSEFRRYQRNTRILDINRKARDIWSDAGFPVLDVFHVTLACQAKSCTEDGSHHNRMVNRAKAHVLLNNFCRPTSCDLS